jgi:hypothetical protein
MCATALGRIAETPRAIDPRAIWSSIESGPLPVRAHGAPSGRRDPAGRLRIVHGKVDTDLTARAREIDVILFCARIYSTKIVIPRRRERPFVMAGHVPAIHVSSHEIQ